MSWFTRTFGVNSAIKDMLKTGFYPWHFLGTAPVFNDYTRDAEKLAAVFRNPALLKIFTLQCDLFSMGKPYVYNKKGVEQPDDRAITRINNPNPMQGMSDWLWSYMFWKMIGNAYLYLESDLIERDNAPMYWLETHKIEWPTELDRQKDKLILSQAKLNRILETEIIYRYEDGTKFTFPLKKIAIAQDLTNGVGNWFKGFSRIDALYKVITNSEASLDSKNISVRYAGKFLVGGTADPKDVTARLMGADEKQDIEEKANSSQQVHAVKSMIDIKRFVDDLKVLELDKSYLADYFLIGAAYNIPRDILEAYTSSTYENQEKAIARHVNYTMEPAGEVLGGRLAQRWGYSERGWRICFGWDHLPFTQVFDNDRANLQQKKAQILQTLLKVGVPLEEINTFLDTNFTIDEAAREAEAANARATSAA